MIFIFFLVLFFIQYYNFTNKNLFNILPNNKLFYFIPENKGGLKIPNQDKKGLHLSYTDNESIDIINNQQLKFSIQIYSNSNYNNVNNFRTKL